MKKLLAKVAAFADDVASYNDPARVASASGRSAATAATSNPALGANAPLDPVLEHLLRNVRSRHVRAHFAKTPAAEYTRRRQVTIQAATFNVNGKKPPPGLRLDDWLGGEMRGRWPDTGAGSEGGAAPAAPAAPAGVGPEAGPDVLAVALQELVPLSAGNVMGVWASDNADAWDRCIAAHLNGEEWAAQRYGPLGPAPAGSAAAAAAAASLLDSKWQGAPMKGGLSASLPSSSSNGKEYVQVAGKQLVGVYLSVWVRRRLLGAVHGVQVATVATGFGGYLGNKGAVAARLRLYDSSLVFVAAHLSAGESEGDELRRNADVAEILRRCAFATGPDGGGAVPMSSPVAAAVSASLGPGHWPEGTAPLLGHDLAIWMGDLNYRLRTAVPVAAPAPSDTSTNGSSTASSSTAAGAVANGGGLTDAEVRSCIRSSRLGPLLAADQLAREMAAGRVFGGWAEGPITFPPTYKFRVGSHAYVGEDASSAALAEEAAGAGEEGTAGNDPEARKRRTPAWCDRVLWRCGAGAAGASMRQLGYWRGEFTLSDHKPVCAAFLAEAVAYDRRAIEGALEGAMREVERLQQSMRPKITVEPVVLEAGEVAPGLAAPLALTLTNTGAVEALFHFVPPPSGKAGGGRFGLDDETPPLPPWLRAEPAEGLLAPGEASTVTLSVRVEGGPGGAAATLAAAGGTQGAGENGAAAVPLEAIVILRIEDSGDKFISVSGRYLRSFLGLSLETLAALGAAPALPPPAAEALVARLGLEGLGVKELTEAAGKPASEGAPALPKEVTALVGWLGGRPGALATPGILAASAEEVLRGAGAEVEAEAASAGPKAQGALLQALARPRLHLDAGRALPPDTSPHAAAALLLLWAAQLPSRLIPPPAADAAVAAPPASSAEAGALLRQHCTPAQRAALNAILDLARKALEPEVAASNGLSGGTLAAALVPWLLPPLGSGEAGADGDGGEAAASRRALLELLLEPAAVFEVEL